jgi:DNA-binding CsgD family transcriptional regulator
MRAAPAYQGAAFVALDWLHLGVLLLDSKGRILFANNAAEEMLMAGTGLHRTNGFLRLERAAETERVRELILSSDRTIRPGLQCHPVAFPRPEGRIPLTGLIVPLERPVNDDVAALLFVTDPSREHWIREDSLQLQLGLTRADGAIARAMLRGDGVAASAKRLGISTTTARTHLNNLFRKTGTRRQAELVRVILQSCAGIRQPESREDPGFHSCEEVRKTNVA